MTYASRVPSHTVSYSNLFSIILQWNYRIILSHCFYFCAHILLKWQSRVCHRCVYRCSMKSTSFSLIRYLLHWWWHTKWLTRSAEIELLQMTWWRHQTETLFALLAICAGNSPVPGEFPAQKSVMQSFDVFYMRPNKRFGKDCEAGDSRRHLAHYSVTVMKSNQNHPTGNWPFSITVLVASIGNRHL